MSVKLNEAITTVEGILDDSAPESGNTMEGIFSHDRRDALVALLDAARGEMKDNSGPDAGLLGAMKATDQAIRQFCEADGNPFELLCDAQDTLQHEILKHEPKYKIWSWTK